MNNISYLAGSSFIINKCQESLGFSSKTTFFCRGQSLPLKLLDFLSGFDILVHSAYGQTESCSVLTANVPGRYAQCQSDFSLGSPVSAHTFISGDKNLI